MTIVGALVLAASQTAFAGSISSPGVIAGPDASAATVDPAAIFYNPAAIAPSEGFDALVDLQTAAIQVQATTTRNDGIDPNTGEAYGTARASVVVPVGFVGATYKVIDERLAVGIGITQPFTGGGDYSGSETNPPPYTSHQRYAGIETRIITIQTTAAVGLTVVEGVHVGAGAGYVYDSLSALQASDPLGTEGAPLGGMGDPYSMDSILEASSSGGHFTWNAGLFVDRWDELQVGLSYAGPSQFRTSGEGTITLPELLRNENYPESGSIPADVTFEMPLPAIGRVMLASQINDKLRVGAGWEYQWWYACCGGPDGDLVITVKDQNPDDANEEIDAPDGSSTAVASTLYSPRRLWNATNIIAFGGFQAHEKLWLGARFQYNQNAVPDYAVSATNLDFTNIGGMIGARYAIGGPVKLGLAYTKFFPQTRTITTSAWDVRSEDDPHFVDDRFSPKSPYKAQTNGTYSADVNIVGVRLMVDL